MNNKIIVDCTTGAQVEEPLTDDEVAEREAAAANPPPEPVDRLAALEERVNAAAALAEQANATAQDVAQAMKPTR